MTTVYNLTTSRNTVYTVHVYLGVYVMTVGTVELVSVCSRLMDISLQLLASVKQLEKSIHQVPGDELKVIGKITFSKNSQLYRVEMAHLLNNFIYLSTKKVVRKRSYKK